MNQVSITKLHLGRVSSDTDSTAVLLPDFKGPIRARLELNPAVGDGQAIAVKLQTGATSTTASTDVTGGGFTAGGTTAGGQTLDLDSRLFNKYVRLNFDISGNNSPAYDVYACLIGTLGVV